MANQDPTPTLRFLLADDSPVARRGLRQLIAPHPHWQVVAEATDGREAVRLAAHHHPDVALVDVIMPTLDGIRATRRIKAVSPTTRIIVYTAHRNRAFRRRALAAGADAFFLKEELQLSALEELVEGWFPQSEERREKGEER
jgi:DNA-binding NarL/FixJ family response regulator